ncbi:MAG: AAA family ATPase [Clostridia bacterium]|nr:AAA family ATPase [Clostridia bacterium]
MSSIKLSPIPTLSVDDTVKTLSQTYISAIETATPFRYVPAVMLWGPPGVGKSQAIRQVATKISDATGKRCNVTDVRLLLFNPIDLRGIPTANAEKTLAIWLKPQIFQMDEGEDVVNILFLDEISAAPQSVQAAAYQITLDRIIGEHKLPENCIVIAAGNRITDKSVAYKMPKALANRLCHIEVESNFESWKRWAISSGVSPKVVGFLSFRHDYLIENESSTDNLAFPTPRSWEMVSRLLNMSGQDENRVYSMICGCIGSGIASEFCSWCRVFSSLPSIEDIFTGRCRTVPKGTDALYAIVSSMTSYAREHKDDLTALEYSIDYALLMPADFSTVLMKNYMAIEENFKLTLLRIPAFAKWARTRGKLINGT